MNQVRNLVIFVSLKTMVDCKSNCSGKTVHIFKDSSIQKANSTGKRHLDATVGTSQFRDERIMEKINKWVEELHVLCETAKTEPQAAYACSLYEYKNKFNCYMRTVSGIDHLLRKADKVFLTDFIPAITGGNPITENERKLLSLAPRLGGMGIPIFEEGCKIEHQNSIMISEHLCNRITDQCRRNEPDLELNNKKKKIKSLKKDRQKKILGIIRNKARSEDIKQNDQNLKSGASSWLRTLPIKEEG